MSDFGIQGEVVLDSSKAEASVDRLGSAAGKMAVNMRQAGENAGKAVDKIGDIAASSAEKFTRSEAAMVASIKKLALEAAKAQPVVDKLGDIEFNIAAKGLDAAKFRPMLDVVQQVSKDAQAAASAVSTAVVPAMGKMQVSAAQTAAALRNVPAQFTDIVVSLQAGQAPLTVLLQQGGQLKDMFGGTGAAAKALGGYVLGLVSPLTVAAATVAAFGVGMAVVESESRKLSNIGIAFKAVGREALLTGDDIKALRREMSLLPQVSKDAAGAVITEFARTREIGADMLKGLSLGINDFAVALGQDVPAAAKTLAKAFADPAKGAKELDDALGFLTSNQLLAINAMTEAGNKAGAQKLMLEALTVATKGLAKEGTELEKATDGFSKKWTEAMGNIGDSATLRRANEVLAGIIVSAGNAAAALSTMKMPDWMLMLPGGVGAGLKLTTSALGALYPSKDQAPPEAPASRPVNWNGGKGQRPLGLADLDTPAPMYTQAGAVAAVRIDYTPKAAPGNPLGAPTAAPAQTSKELDNQAKFILEANKNYKSQKSIVGDIRKDIDLTAKTLAAINAEEKGSGKPPSERAEKLQEILDGQKEKLAAALKKGTTNGAAGVGQTEVAGILAGVEAQRAYLAALKENGAEATKQTEGQKLVIKLTKELETSMTGATRASKEKALAAAKDRADVDQEVVAEERRIAGLERSKQAYASVVDEVRKTADAINTQADEMAAANSMWGKGRVAVEQYRLALIQARLAEVDNTSEGSYDPAYVAGLRAQEAAQTRKVNEARIADGKTLNEQADELLQKAQASAKAYGDEADLSGKTQLERAKIVARREVELRYAQRIAEVDKTNGATPEDKDRSKATLREAERIESEQAVAKVVRDDWDKTADQINQSLTNALMEGFESGKSMGKSLADSLKNTFKTLVLRPVINAVMSPISGAVNALVSGVTGGGAGGGGLGGLSTMFTAAQQGYNLYAGEGMISQAWGGISGALGIGQAGQVAAAGQSLAGMVPGVGGGAAGGGGMMAGMGGVGIVGLIMLGIINALGGMRSESMVGSGLAGTLGGNNALTPWQEWREGGTLFDGSSFATHNPLEELSQRRAELQRLRDTGQGETNYAMGIAAVVTDLEKTTKGLATQTAVFDREITKGYKLYRTNVVDMANSLGLAGSSIEDFAYTLGAQDLNLQGLKPEEIQAKIQETFGKAGTEMVQGILGSWREVTDIIVNTWSDTTDPHNVVYTTETTVNKRQEYVPSEFAKEGETAIQTLTRLATSFNTLNEAADALGFGIQKGSLSLADFADDFIEAFGGLEAFTTKTSAFLQAYYTDDERKTYLIDSAVRKADSLGIKGLTAEGIRGSTRGQFRDYVNTAASNPALYKEALDLAIYLDPVFEAFDAQAPVVQEVANVVDELTQAYQNAVKSLTSDRDNLAVEVLRAQGDEAGAKALERSQYMAQFAGLDEVRRKEIETLYDGNVATRAYIQGIKDAAQAQLDAIAKLRTDSLALIDTAAGKTDVAMAAYERAADKERERLQGSIDSIKAVFQATEDGAKSFFGEVESVAKFQGQQGRNFITQALASVQAGGALADGKELSDAIAAVSKDIGSTQFATQADADFQRLVVANELEGLKDASGDQLDTAEAQLKALNDQVQWAREQVDALRGIDSKLKTLPEAIAALIQAYNEESQTRTNVKATALLGSGNATFDIKKGVGTTSSGAYFEQDALIAATQEAIAQGATAMQIYDGLKATGFSLADANEIYKLPAGTLEKQAELLGRPIFHDGTPYVPETGYALLQKGEMVIPTAYNPNAHGRVGGDGVGSSRLEALVAVLIERVSALEAPLSNIDSQTAATEQLIDRVTDGGNSIKADVMNEVTLA